MSLVEVITDENPCGKDYKYEDEYIAIEIEVEKDFNISNTGETQWDMVSTKCENLLKEHTKDLKILSYWLYAQWRLNGLNTFNASLQIYAEIIEKYNKELYPKITKRKIKTFEWLENLLEEPLLKGIEEFTKEALIELSKNLEILQEHIPITTESDYVFLKDVRNVCNTRIKRIENEENEALRQQEIQKEEELKRQKENEALSEAEKIRRSEEAGILEKFSTNTVEVKNNLISLEVENIDAIFKSIIALSKPLLEKAPGDYFSYKMLFSLSEILIVESYTNAISEYDDFIPSNDIIFAVRRLPEENNISITQLVALIEQLLIRPTWIEGFFIASRILYKLGRTEDALHLENDIFHFVYQNEKILNIQINNQKLIPEDMLAWMETKALSLNNNSGDTIEYQHAYQKVLKVKKEQNQHNALILLEEYYQKAQCEEERFRWRLLFVDFALEIGDKKLALSLLYELERIIELHKINLWQPNLAIATYEMFLKPLFTQELDVQYKERIYNKLSILDVQKVMK